MNTRSDGAAPPGRLVIGSRRSRLARIQAEWVGGRLTRRWPGLEIEYVAVSTEGDRDRKTPLPEIGGKGLFTEDLERALVAGELDLAVHSLKDLPTGADDSLMAVPEREDPRDVLVLAAAQTGESLESLPGGLRVGTSSTRRSAQLRRAIRDVIVEPVRGNVETRLGRVTRGELDGVVLAAAGLARLGLKPTRALTLGPPGWLGAPGQGALAVQGRHGDERVRRLAAGIHHPVTAAAIAAERSFLSCLGGGCHLPVAALADVEGSLLRLRGAVYGSDPAAGVFEVEGTAEMDRAADLGSRLGAALLDRGVAAHLA